MTGQRFSPRALFAPGAADGVHGLVVEDEKVTGVTPVLTGLTSGDSSVTITDNGDGTLNLAASGGGGGGGSSAPVVKRTANGSPVFSGAQSTFAVVDSALDITLPAVAGDIIMMGIGIRVPSHSNYLLFDVGSMNGATILNRWQGGNADGVQAWVCSPRSTQEYTNSPVEFFNVVLGDLVSGNVKLRLFYRCTGTTITATTGLMWWARNVGQ